MEGETIAAFVTLLIIGGVIVAAGYLLGRGS